MVVSPSRVVTTATTDDGAYETAAGRSSVSVSAGSVVLPVFVSVRESVVDSPGSTSAGLA